MTSANSGTSTIPESAEIAFAKSQGRMSAKRMRRSERCASGGSHHASSVNGYLHGPSAAAASPTAHLALLLHRGQVLHLFLYQREHVREIMPCRIVIHRPSFDGRRAGHPDACIAR
jgi:hypothetical protein